MNARVDYSASKHTQNMEISLTCRWLHSVNDISAQDWSRCFPSGDAIYSQALQQAVEKSGIAHAIYHYLHISVNGQVCAIIPCFEFGISMVVVAPPWVQRLAGWVRKVFPGFLYLRAFIAGTPLATCRDFLGIAPTTSSQHDSLLKLAAKCLTEQATRLGIGFMAIKEIRARDLPAIAYALGRDVIWADSPATTYLYLSEPGGEKYRDRLRNQYRKIMSQRMRKFNDGGFRWEICQEFSQYAARMHDLYLQVLYRSTIRFETLGGSFFSEVGKHLRDEVCCILCFHGSVLVAFALLFKDKKTLHPAYLGLDYTYRDGGALYFNCIYKTIEIAESMGQAVLELGQTNYTTKASLGVVSSRLHIGVRHRNPLLNWLIRCCKGILFPPTALPRQQRAFKDMAAHYAGLRRRGVSFDEA